MLRNRVLSAGIATGLFAAVAFASDGIGNLSLTATSCNPEVGASIDFAISGSPGAIYTLRAGQPGCSYLPGVGPIDLVMAGSTVVASGMIPPSGTASFTLPITYADLTDMVFQRFAAAAGSPTGTAVSNPARLEVNDNSSMTFASTNVASQPLPPLNGRRVACGDVDGDGDWDVYVPTFGNGMVGNTQSQNLLLLNTGTGLFTDATATNLPAILEPSNRAILVDVDGDFDLDVVTANGPSSTNAPQPTPSRIYKNDGAGRFTLFAELPGGADYLKDVAAGDVDGDGDVDLVLGRDGNGQGAPERVLINGGTGVYTEASGGSGGNGGGGNGNGNGGGGNGNGRGGGGGGSGGGSSGATTGITANSDKTFAVHLVDVDGDGDSDVVTVNSDAGGARVYRNNGAGSFTEVSGAFPSADTAYASDLALGDLDGDGDVDAVVVIRTLVLPLVREVRVFRNDGDGSFSRIQNGVTGIPSNDEVFSACLGDADGDGDLDAVVVSSTQARDWMLVNDGTGRFAANSSGVPAPIGTGAPVFFDANGNNVLDVIYSANSSHGTVQLMVR